jgi:CHAT domain-containing protein/Tfp pilus assembly protein PilF
MGIFKRLFAIGFAPVLLVFFHLDLLSVQAVQQNMSQKNRRAIVGALQKGKEAKRNGDYTGAINIIEDALKTARNQRDSDTELSCLLMLEDLYWMLQKFEESLTKIQKAKLLTQELDIQNIGEKCEAILIIHRKYKEGDDLLNQNHLEDAKFCLEEAIRLARNIKSEGHELKCLRLMSLIFLQANDMDKFLSFNEEALEIAYKLNSILDQVKCLNNIGAYHIKTANYSKALAFLEGALTKISNFEIYKEEESNCLTNIGITYLDMGNYEKSLLYFNKALSVDMQIKNENYMILDLNNIGLGMLGKGRRLGNDVDIRVALYNFKKLKELAQKNRLIEAEIKAYINMGFSYTLLKEYKYGVENLRAALHLAEELKIVEEIGIINNNLGNISFSCSEFAKAKIFYRQAIEQAIKIHSLEVLWESYFGLGQCYEKEGNFSLARIFYQWAIGVIDQIRNHIFIDTFKTGYVWDKQKVYESLINLLASWNETGNFKNHGRDIFYFVEKAKSRAFLEGLGEATIDIMENINPELKEQEKEISKEIALTMYSLSQPSISTEDRHVAFEKLSREEDEYMRLLSRMRADLPQSATLISPDVCSLGQIQNELLNDKTAVVEYYLGEEISLAMFIMKEDLEWQILPPKKEIENSLRAYLKYLSMPPKSDFEGFQASRRLFNELLFPLKNKIGGNIEQLIIIPDGILYFLPFETLMRPNHSIPSEHDYLINQISISYAPSCSALHFIAIKRKASNIAKKLLAIGKPIDSRFLVGENINKKSSTELMRDTYINQGFEFSTLPFSKKEVLSISRLFPGKKRDVYLEMKAKEEAVKNADLKKYQILHFACHGLLDEQVPSRSALVLALDEDPTEDGFLQVREIYNLRLGAELVILSACQTGKGRIENGEGIMGLPRIFFYTGARSVVSALWKINDRSTSIFMEQFYRNLASEKTKADALRQAKMEMIKSRYSHPYYWAAFVLHGDFERKIDFN